MTAPSRETPAVNPFTVFMFKRFFDRAGAHASNDPDMVEAERFWRRLGELSPPAHAERTSLWKRTGALGIALAAAACVLIAGLSLWGHLAGQPQPWRSFSTGHGRQGIVMLEDGSSVTLAAQSKVSVRFSRKQRELRLVSGQALFEVAHDRSRPFIVRARNGSITAVGTAFNIRLSGADAEVTVVNGVVDVGLYKSDTADMSDTPATVARATRGEQVHFGLQRKDGFTLAYMNRRTGVDLANIGAWTRGKLFFDGTPLAEAIATVNAYSSSQLVLKDQKLASMPVYGILNQGDLEGLLVLVNDKRAIGVAP